MNGYLVLHTGAELFLHPGLFTFVTVEWFLCMVVIVRVDDALAEVDDMRMCMKFE